MVGRVAERTMHWIAWLASAASTCSLESAGVHDIEVVGLRSGRKEAT
jgi:hypothetical protein